MAPGIKGMVMLVFTLPSFPYVFKVIRDRFAPPKDTVREQVQARYDLVFKHDRVGRLVDAQEFRWLTLEAAFKLPLNQPTKILLEAVRAKINHG